MSKQRDPRREAKKTPVLGMKEKRAAKKAKKLEKSARRDAT
jgi:hypothetical protein